jgi:hypothetical protein
LFNDPGLGNIVDPNNWPPNYSGKSANKTDKSYTEIGVALIRLCLSQNKQYKESVVYAYPLDKEFSSCPLLNEIVGVVKFLDKYYYSNKINYKNLANTSADFRFEPTYGQFEKIVGLVRKDKSNSVASLKGPESKFDSTTEVKTNVSFRGILGKYFWFNRKIRNLRRFEGDTIIESRFGQSIRFGAYDDNRKNDVGTHNDYKGDGTINTYNNLPAGGGNPMILIRNRQSLSKPTTSNINVGGYILEDINNDGSSIHITSGLTVSKFRQNTIKSIFTKGSDWKFPPLTGEQIVISSERLVFASRANETMHFSKKRYMIVTDDEYVLDAQKQIVLNTNNKTVINSPAIYLGDYNDTNEPAILGQTLVDCLFDLCNWILNHTHHHDHIHPVIPNTLPEITKAVKDFPYEPQSADLVAIRDRLHSVLSRRVFLSGGGYSPGHNGSGDGAVKITGIGGESSPTGMPGGWHGRSRRIDGVLNDNNGAVGNMISNYTSYMQSFINENIKTMSESELKGALEKMIDNSIKG